MEGIVTGTIDYTTFSENNATKINVLGTEYLIFKGISAEENEYLKDCDGYCDFYARKIVLGKFTKENGYEHGDLEYYERKVLRHEIIHAFLHESGLHDLAMDEQIVEWLAIQFPKINQMFEELEIKA